MAVTNSRNWANQQRVDLPHLKAIESAVRDDFDTLFSAFVMGENKSYVIRGFTINTVGAIGSSATSLQMIVDNSAILHGNSNIAGSVFSISPGASNETISSTTNTKVQGAFTPSTLNYVGIELVRPVDPTTAAQVFLWNPTSKVEISKTLPLAEVLTYQIVVSSSPWASNVLPISVIETDGSNNVVSIEDRRPMLLRLGTGGSNTPNPSYKYPWTNDTEGRTENYWKTTSSTSPFKGGDKQLLHFKEWADAIMSQILEIKGTTYWYSGNQGGSILNLRGDLAQLQMTGSGKVIHSDAVAGRMNWDQDIFLTFVGSRLSYKISANPSSSNLQLVDDEVAYINFVRGVDIAPPLILTNSSDIVTSVGAVSWTTDVQADDWIKVATADDTKYYQISSVDSLSQVTLTENYDDASTGSPGVACKYAYGTYDTVAVPSTNRHVQTALRQNVPFDENAYWIFLRKDNGGGVARVYMRGISGGELQQGESRQISDNTTLEVLSYIGSPGEADPTPDYTNSLITGVAEVTTLTFPAATLFSGGEYFTFNSADDDVQYYTYAIKAGAGSDPQIANKTAVPVSFTGTATAVQVATAFHSAINPLSTHNSVNNNNGTITVTNADVGITTDMANFSMPAGFNIAVNTQGAGSHNYALVDTENLTKGEKRLDDALRTIVHSASGTSLIINQDRSMKLIEGGDWTFNLGAGSPVIIATASGPSNGFVVIDSGSKLIAQSFTPASNISLTDINFQIRKSGVPVFDIRLTIYPDNSGQPNVLLPLGTSSVIAAAGLTTSFTATTNFNFPSPVALTSGQKYWFVANPQNITTINAADNAQSWYESTVDLLVGQVISTSANSGSSWSANPSGRDLNFTASGLTPGVDNLTLSANAYIQIPGLLKERNTILAQTINMTAADQIAYVSINRTAGTTANLTVTVADETLVPTGNNICVIARRTSDGIIVGKSSFKLIAGQSQKLDRSISNQTATLLGAGVTDATGLPTWATRGSPLRNIDETQGILEAVASIDNEVDKYFGQLLLKKHESSVSKARILGSDRTVKDTATITQEINQFLIDFTGAVIDFSTGSIFKTDGTTALGSNFAPFSIPVGQYFWYGVALLPSVVTSDNKQTSVVQISPASAANATLANAPKPLIIGDKKLGAILVQNIGGTITISQVLRLGVGSGSGSGSNVKAKYLDPVSTSLPTGATVTIDGVAGVNGDTVLYTALVSGNNEIYKLAGVGTSITWTPQNSFSGQLIPTDGDTVHILAGNAFQDQTAKFNGTNFLVNDVVRFFNGVSGNFWELGSIKSTLIANNTTANIFSVAFAGSENINVEYSVVRGTSKETGVLNITTDGANAAIAKSGAYLGTAGVTFNAAISGSNIILSYTSNNSGATGTIKYFVKRWSDAVGGPTGIPTYSGGGGGSVAAGGANTNIQYNSSGVLAGDNRFDWDATNGAMDLNGLKYHVLSPAITLNDNQASPISVISYDQTAARALFIEYSAVRGTIFRTGRLIIAHNGTAAVISDDFVETSTFGITFSVAISGSNIEVRYTTTSTGASGQIKYTTRRWN